MEFRDRYIIRHGWLGNPLQMSNSMGNHWTKRGIHCHAWLPDGVYSMTGWCFGTWIWFFHSVGNVIIPTDEVHHFSELKPPTRWILFRSYKHRWYNHNGWQAAGSYRRWRISQPENTSVYWSKESLQTGNPSKLYDIYIDIYMYTYVYIWLYASYIHIYCIYIYICSKPHHLTLHCLEHL